MYVCMCIYIYVVYIYICCIYILYIYIYVVCVYIYMLCIYIYMLYVYIYMLYIYISYMLYVYIYICGQRHYTGDTPKWKCKWKKLALNHGDPWGILGYGCIPNFQLNPNAPTVGELYSILSIFSPVK